MTTIVIQAYGTRGDVAPYTGLAVRLRQAGYYVAIAAQAPYEELITGLGIEYRYVPKDTEATTKESALAQQFIDGARMRPSRAMVAEMSEGLDEVGPTMIETCADADLLVLSPAATVLGYHIAEGMGIPSVGAYLQPMAPTGDFPPVAFGTRSFGRWANRRMGRLTGIGERVYLSHINQVREQLGLSSTTVRAYQRDRVNRWPILHGFSEYVLPRPSDWHPGLEVTGYWWPAVASGWTPPAELTDFLAAGPAPIFIGLGSTATLQGPRLSRIFTEVIRRAGVRAVVQTGWAGLDCDGPDILTVGDVPHEWLFPKMAAVVHHAGAGTTAAALRAGVPAVLVPGIMDQPFWAKRLVELGVAPGSIRRTHLDPDRLAALITEAVTDDSYRQRAQEISQHLATEDGPGRAVESITRLLNRTHPNPLTARS